MRIAAELCLHTVTSNGAAAEQYLPSVPTRWAGVKAAGKQRLPSRWLGRGELLWAALSCSGWGGELLVAIASHKVAGR